MDYAFIGILSFSMAILATSVETMIARKCGPQILMLMGVVL